MVDIFERLDRLKPIAKSLNAESNSINELITKVEDKLSRLKLGVGACIPLYGDINGRREAVHTDEQGAEHQAYRVSWLSYGRLVNGEWGLTVHTNVYLANSTIGKLQLGDLVEEGEAVGLRDASRKMRIDALNELPDLIDCIEANAAELQAKLMKAKESLK